MKKLLSLIILIGLLNLFSVSEAAKLKQSPSLKVSQVKVTNNRDKNDSIVITGINIGEVISIYSNNNKVISNTKPVTNRSVTIYIKQLGTNSGYINVTVTKKKMAESKKLKVPYQGEIIPYAEKSRESLVKVLSSLN